MGEDDLRGWKNRVCLLLPKSAWVIRNLTFSACEHLSFLVSAYKKTQKFLQNSSVIPYLKCPFSASPFCLIPDLHQTVPRDLIILSNWANIYLSISRKHHEHLSQIVHNEWTKEIPATYLCFYLFQI